MALIVDPTFVNTGYEYITVPSDSLVDPFARSTCREIINDAYDLLGLQSLTPTELERGRRSLNLLLRSLTNNFFVYTVLQFETTTSGATIIPEAGTKNVDSACLVINSEDVPLKKLSIQEWDKIVNKTTTGQPLVFWFDQSLSTINFYPVPVETYSVKYRTLSHITNATDVDAPIDVPRGAELMIVYLLAALLAPVFGLNRDGFYQLGEIEKRNFLASQYESWGNYVTGKPQAGIV